jgi:hypothetical protein
VLARAGALTAVSLFLAHGLERKPNTMRHQWREWCSEAKAQRGGPRHELAGETCFAPLLAWVLRWGEGNPRAVAVAATTLGQGVVGLVGSGGYRGCAIPVAGRVSPATEKPAGRGAWLGRLRPGRAAVPGRFFVLVWAARGL